MRTVVTDIDVTRPQGGQYCTVYFRQGKLSGNMLIPREAVENRGGKLLQAAQYYLDYHLREIPSLKDLPSIAEAGPVTRYLVEASLSECDGIMYVDRREDAASILVNELHEIDDSIKSFDDVIASLEEDFKKFPAMRDKIEYHRLDEYAPGGEPLLQCYTGLPSCFAVTIDVKRDRLIDFDTERFSKGDFQKLCQYMEKNQAMDKAGYKGAEAFGTIYAGDVCIDIEGFYDSQKQWLDVKFICYLPVDKREDTSYAEPVKDFVYGEHKGSFGLREAIDVDGCLAGKNFEQFKSQLKNQLNNYAQARLDEVGHCKDVDALMSKSKFWQCMEAKEKWPTCKIIPSPVSFGHANSSNRYNDVEIIPHGFHDETEPAMDEYPVIADDSDLLYIEEDHKEGRAASENARYRLVLKDRDMNCTALGEKAKNCPIQGALYSSNDFDAVYAKAMELLPMMREAKERLEAMYETAVTIRTASSHMANQFMQVYWNAYNRSNMTNKDDHEAACCKAIRYCMDKGATKKEVLRIVDTKAPMAAWEKDGKYAVRMVGEVKREKEAEKTNTGRARR